MEPGENSCNQSNFEQKYNKGNTFPDFKIYNKISIIKTVLNENRHTGLRNKI